jgi:AbiV family abortive infection protein
MAAEKTVTSTHLLQGAVYALEQCGHLLHDANVLYRSRSHATAVVLAAFAREELGRANILFDLRDKVVAGEAVTTERIRESCDDHETKQEWAVASTQISTTNDTVLGKLLQTRHQKDSQTEEWKAADKEIKKIDASQRKRAKTTRHQQRMRALYVEPNESGLGWNRPRDIGRQAAHDFLNHAVNDYGVQIDKLNPEFLKARDTRQLLKELTDWKERPELPAQEWPRLVEH